MPSPKRKAAVPLAPDEFGELAATEWFRQAAGREGSLNDVIQLVVHDVLQDLDNRMRGLGLELDKSGGADSPPAALQDLDNRMRDLDLELDMSGGADFPPASLAAEPCAHVERGAGSTVSLRAPTLDWWTAVEHRQSESRRRHLEEVTAEVLDAGEMYQCSGSVWNAAIMLGHSSLGFQVSLMLLLVLLMNIFVQVSFCIIVWEYMLEHKMEDADLDRLLSFRLGVAHDVGYADKVGQRSLARQVCEKDPKLHTSAMQTSFLENYDTFHVGGPALMFLAMLLWIAHIGHELRQVVAQVGALCSLRRGRRTIVVLVGARQFEEMGHVGTSVSMDPEYIDKLTVTARLVEVTKIRVLAVCVGVVLPRLVVAGLLAICGVRLLGQTDRMEDLVLNAMALSFVLGIDEEFFETFLPRRVQTLVYNLEAIPLNAARRVRRVPVKDAVVVLILVLVSLAASHAFVMQPCVAKLEQSRDILCSGQLDFVFSLNSASGMVHVARSAQEAPLTDTERIVLQVGQPLLRSNSYWKVDPSLVILAQTGDPPVQFEPLVAGKASLRPQSLDLVSFDGGSFQRVANIGGSSLEEAAGSLSCADFRGEEYAEALRGIVQDSMLTPRPVPRPGGQGDSEISCDYIDRHLCGKMNSTRLRALCPLHCGCYEGALVWSGLFGTSAFGCPTECLKYPPGTMDMLLGEAQFPCENTGPGNFSNITEYLPHVYQSYHGGEENMKFTFRDIYLHYVSGLQEYVTHDRAVAEGLWPNVGRLRSYHDTVDWPTNQELIRHIRMGRFFEELAAGTWTIFPGTPHPRNLTGCDYLASFEITFLINVDLCVGGRVASIRPWCPRACGCSRGMPECPGSCE